MHWFLGKCKKKIKTGKQFYHDGQTRVLILYKNHVFSVCTMHSCACNPLLFHHLLLK